MVVIGRKSSVNWLDVCPDKGDGWGHVTYMMIRELIALVNVHESHHILARVFIKQSVRSGQGERVEVPVDILIKL